MKKITKYWLKHFVVNNLCSLCGNSGIIDTTGVRTATGVKVGRENYCICPNGQAKRKLRSSSAKGAAAMSPEALRAESRANRKLIVMGLEPHPYNVGDSVNGKRVTSIYYRSNKDVFGELWITLDYREHLAVSSLPPDEPTAETGRE